MEFDCRQAAAPIISSRKTHLHKHFCAVKKVQNKLKGSFHLQKCCFSNTTSNNRNQEGFVDPALIYGRTHSQEAQDCLKVPPLPKHDNNDNHSPLTLESLEDYWEWRKWGFPVSEEERNLPLAKALVSHVLSAPLTMAKFYEETFDTNIISAQATHRLQFHWCCVGARAEATLPMEFWMELLVALTHLHTMQTTGPTCLSDSNHEQDENQLHLDLFLDFVGPDIHPQIPNKTLEYRNSKLHLNWLYKGFLHDYADEHRRASWTAFVLLNPGLAHPHLTKGWKPTLHYILEQAIQEHKPVLLTAHSQLDAVRDWNLLQSELSQIQLPPFRRNAFASHITYEDPFDKTHMVQPNHSFLIIEQ